MGKRRKKNIKDLALWVLSVVVLAQTFLLFAIFSQKKEAKHPKRISKAVLEKKTPEKPPPKPGSLGRIAVIMDDVGYNAESCEAIKSIKTPLAVAILPWLEYSQSLAECVHGNHQDVMLHLPLEPHWNQEKYPENYIIKTSLSRRRVEGMLEQALRSVPYASGVNNHMGSKATEDGRLMSIILSRLKEKHIFFVDSLVTNHSVCRDLAKKLNVHFAKRDIFLDNKNTREDIERQFAQLVARAQRKGYAIAIGHDRPLTWQILKEQTESLQKQGFKIVSVRELLE